MTNRTGLDALRDDGGWFRVLAIDHRDSLRAFLAPDDPGGVEPATLTSIKVDLARAVLPYATGVMLEPEYSIPDVIDAGAVPPGVGFIAALESQGYLADPGAAPTSVLAGWSVVQAAASGASAAKLLLPYHPDHPLAERQEAVAADVLADCRRVGIPLVLEPLCFGLADPRDRPSVVLRTVARFAAIAPDLLKLPFPVDPAVETDPIVWADRCDAVTAACSMPWVLLSGGGGFDDFAHQVAVATRHGCAGFMVGRALWGEAARSAPRDRLTVIDDVVLPRWHRLSEITLERSR